MSYCIIMFKWNSKLGYFPINHAISIESWQHVYWKRNRVDFMHTHTSLSIFVFNDFNPDYGNGKFHWNKPGTKWNLFSNCCLKSLKVNSAISIVRVVLMLHVIVVGDFWIHFSFLSVISQTNFVILMKEKRKKFFRLILNCMPKVVLFEIYWRFRFSTPYFFISFVHSLDILIVLISIE